MILLEAMWICFWHSLMKRMIDLKTAYKEQIAVQPGGDLFNPIVSDL